MLILSLLLSLASANLMTMIAQGLATTDDVMAAVQAGFITPAQATVAIQQLTQCPNGVHFDTIPTVSTPMPVGGTIGYAEKFHGPGDFEPEYLSCCQDPIDSDIPDMTGMYEINLGAVVSYARIEQCGSRILLAGGGVIHDFPALNDDEVDFQDVLGMCVGLPSAWVDSPVAMGKALGIQSPLTCMMLEAAGAEGCSCHGRPFTARSNGNCIEGYYENPDEPEVSWCKQDDGSIIRTIQKWVSGNAVTLRVITFTPYNPSDAATETSCPPAIQTMLDRGMSMEQIAQMIVTNQGDVSVLAACQ